MPQITREEIASGAMQFEDASDTLSEVTGVSNISITEDFGSIEVRNNQTASYAHLLPGQDDWTGTVDIDFYHDGSATDLASSIKNILNRGRNHLYATIVLTYHSDDGSTVYTENSVCKITGIDRESPRDRSGIPTMTVNVRGIQEWSEGLPTP